MRRSSGTRVRREGVATVKEWGGRVRCALVYPNRYEVATANLGFTQIHARIDGRPDALCDRAVLVSGRDEVTAGVDLGTTIERGRPLSDYDVVAVSLSYENDLANLPSILSAGGIPPNREDRAADGGRHPFVLVGGFAASLNPEPSGVVADAVFVGDGETAIGAFLDLGVPRPLDNSYLRELAALDGFFVPGGYEARFNGPEMTGDFKCLVPMSGFPSKVRRVVVDLAAHPPLPVVRPSDAGMGDMILVETSRGCPGMCPFCAAAHACPRFRSVPVEHVRAAVDAEWGAKRKVGLVGAAVLDWPPFRDFAREIIERGGSVSPASIRADKVDAEIAGLLALSGHKTVALAPEVGDEKARARLAKKIPDATFFRAGRTLALAGIVSFKLYFVAALPGTEAEADVAGLVSFVRAFRDEVLDEARRVGKMGTVTAVVSGFSPKPLTPFQFAPVPRPDDVARRIEGVTKALRGLPNIAVSTENAREALVQSVLGLSDRRVASLLFRPGAKATIREKDVAAWAPSSALFEPKSKETPFPWDVIDGGLSRDALWRRYEAACHL